MPLRIPDRFRAVFWALILSNSLSVALFLARALDAGNLRYWFLLWNLVLGWMPLAFAWWLEYRLRTSGWLQPANLALTLAWLGFLPNSFYLISDLVHLHASGEVSILYDAVMLFSFIFNGLVAGFMSIYLVHEQALRRLKDKRAHGLIGLVFLMTGLAVYIGRYLRWNTWDILLSPAGLLFDISEGVVNPSAHPQAAPTTLVFFLLLGSMYIVVWQLARLLSANRR